MGWKDSVIKVNAYAPEGMAASLRGGVLSRVEGLGVPELERANLIDSALNSPWLSRAAAQGASK